MDEREMIDGLYALWVKTTGADKCQWEYTQEEQSCDITAVEPDGWEHIIAFGAYPVDANFIVAIHAGMPELVRRFHAALDEADRADFDRDSLHCRIAELEVEVAGLKDDLRGLIG